MSLFNEDQTNQVAYSSILLDAAQAPDTAGGEATAHFLRRIFATTGIRKVDAETTALSLPQLDSGMFLGGREEGRLVGHVLRGGEAHDLVVLATTRESFSEGMARILSYLDGQNSLLDRAARRQAHAHPLCHLQSS